jgi:hypothetical protein
VKPFDGNGITLSKIDSDSHPARFWFFPGLIPFDRRNALIVSGISRLFMGGFWETNDPIQNVEQELIKDNDKEKESADG